MSFFIRNKKSAGPQLGVKRGLKKKGPTSKVDGPRTKKQKAVHGDEIPSDSDIESNDEINTKNDDYSSSEEEETVQEKRLRLAKQYLSQLEVEEAQRASDDEFGGDLIAQRLKKDVLEQAGKLQREVAKQYSPSTQEDVSFLRGHQLSVTCLVISPCDKFVYSAGKDCSLIKWCLKTKKKVKTIAGGRKDTTEQHVGHTAHVLAIAISSDGKYLVSGDMNNLIQVWKAETMERLHIFRGHRGPVSGLAFRKGSHQLFSASHDKTVKVWNLDEMAYVETLYGHQDIVTAIDSLARERAITAGGRDNSIRIWKIVEESQLVFHGHGGSIDCVALINEENFISGADDNSLSLWSVMKKKPLVRVSNAHGRFEDGRSDEKDCWISAVASLQHTDIIASGSKDGCVRLWQATGGFRGLTPMFSVTVPGFVNSLAFSSDGSMLIAGIGQEHKLGRWWRLKNSKNGICIIKLNKQHTDDAQSRIKPVGRNE